MYGVPVSCCEQVIEDHCSYSALGKSHDGFHRLLLLHPYGQCSCSICFIAQEERNIDHTHICTHTHMCEHTHTQREMNTHTVYLSVTYIFTFLYTHTLSLSLFLMHTHTHTH